LKNICYDKAVKEGIQHGRLPIGDYIKLSTRHVLTVNQVLEIMLRWLEARNWEKALLDVIPKRKFPELQDQKREGNDNQSESTEALEPHDSTDYDGEGGDDSVE
jgi:tRNA (guanine9-N1)-methyltransferase